MTNPFETMLHDATDYVPTTPFEVADWELGLALVRARAQWERGEFDEAELMRAVQARKATP